MRFLHRCLGLRAELCEQMRLVAHRRRVAVHQQLQVANRRAVEEAFVEEQHLHFHGVAGAGERQMQCVGEGDERRDVLCAGSDEHAACCTKPNGSARIKGLKQTCKESVDSFHHKRDEAQRLGFNTVVKQRSNMSRSEPQAKPHMVETNPGRISRFASHEATCHTVLQLAGVTGFFVLKRMGYYTQQG